LEISLPSEFCERMQRLLGDEEYRLFMESFEKSAQKGLRINPYQWDKKDEISMKIGLPMRPISYEKNGFFLDHTESGIGNLPLHHAGAFYIQEPAAMLPVAAAAIRPGDYVLDVCAAPGGKSTQIASAIGPTGLLCSNEFVLSRAKILMSNIERLGIPNAIVTNTDAAHLKEWYPRAFDCVFVDAPCSGEGMFRKNSAAIAEWSPQNVAMCAKRSLEILSDASACLREGGLLVYSTCTYAVEENEELIAQFLDAHPDYTVEILPDAVRQATSCGIQIPSCREDLRRAARCYPHITGGEGQFVCVMRKHGDAPREQIVASWEKLTSQERTASDTLLKELFGKGEVPFALKKFRGNLYAVPPQMEISGVCFCCGVRFGELRGNRIVPHHQLFSTYGKQMVRQWNFSSEDIRVKQYLHGDTVSCDNTQKIGDDGFGCVLVDGCALGGGKKVGDIIKNHYPKGLRTNGV